MALTGLLGAAASGERPMPLRLEADGAGAPLYYYLTVREVPKQRPESRFFRHQTLINGGNVESCGLRPLDSQLIQLLGRQQPTLHKNGACFHRNSIRLRDRSARFEVVNQPMIQPASCHA